MIEKPSSETTFNQFVLTVQCSAALETLQLLFANMASNAKETSKQLKEAICSVIAAEVQDFPLNIEVDLSVATTREKITTAISNRALKIGKRQLSVRKPTSSPNRILIRKNVPNPAKKPEKISRITPLSEFVNSPTNLFVVFRHKGSLMVKSEGQPTRIDPQLLFSEVNSCMQNIADGERVSFLIFDGQINPTPISRNK